MPVDRPTFSESWYRVADLRPRLLATIQSHRQHFRGQTWHVLSDPASNQFFRLNEAAYRFVALLDGRRTVAQSWQICNEQLGDDAPTQGEAIQLLGQLYTSNLLLAELPPDAEGLFRRYHKRITREIQGYLMNILFLRIPIYDPDRFLDAWIKVFGWMFSWFGAVVWTALMATGLYFVLGHFGELTNRFASMFSQETLAHDLWLMYSTFVVVKVAHEFGHAFSCKKFGLQTGTGGEVHVMGVMFLVFTPLPYVDASSSWAFRRKWHRMVVGMGGMIVELAIAAVAAIVWANTGKTSTMHDVAYNVIFIAGVSTVLFNANPLLRYDGYYILSDLLEMPNLWQRSRQYTYYLVKKYVWGVRRPTNPANTRGERVWLFGYGVASAVYRVFICVAILLFVANKLFILGAVLAGAALIAWVFVPLGKFVHYLATSGELMRVRGRAVLTTLATAMLIVAGIGLVRVPDCSRADGVVQAVHFANIHARGDGFVRAFLPSGLAVTPGGRPLLQQESPDLAAKRKETACTLRELAFRRQEALDERKAGAAEDFERQIAGKQADLALFDDQLAHLSIRAPFAGQWFSPLIHRLQGAYVHQGDQIGVVASMDDLIVLAVIGQEDARVVQEADAEVEIRVRGRPDLKIVGHIEQTPDGRNCVAGLDRLPSPALGSAAGGPIAVSPEDRQGTKAVERFFEIRIKLDAQSLAALKGMDNQPVKLLHDQRVVVRFHTRSRPLAAQWWRSALQLVQKSFHV